MDRAEPGTPCLEDLDAFALIDGACPEPRRAALRAHVDGCAACRDLLADLVEVGPEATRPGRTGAQVRRDEIAAPGYAFGPAIAEGGMGRIYRATDTSLGREVVIKVPRSRAPVLLRRFEREAAITARLQHPGIVPVHGAGELAGGTPFYVMRFVDGVSLEDAVERAPDRAARHALLRHLLAVADTMAYVHGERIAHRDLKPSNVLLSRFGEAVIIDWGLAKQLDSAGAPTPASRDSLRLAGELALGAGAEPPPTHARGATTRAGDVLGTPMYMAPEQAAGAPIDQRADVYALGVMLRFVLAGALAPEDAAPELAAAPAALRAIHERATAFDPDERYADAGELAEALRAALAPEPLPATPPPPPAARAPRRGWRAWRLGGVIGAAALGALGAWRALTPAVAPPAPVAASAAATPPPAPAPRRLERLGALPPATRSIAASPDGTRVACAGKDRVEVRDLGTDRRWTRAVWVTWPGTVMFEGADALLFGVAADSAGLTRQLERWRFADTARVEAVEALPADRSWVGTTTAGRVFTDMRTSRVTLETATITTEVRTAGRVPVHVFAQPPRRGAFAMIDPLDAQTQVIRVVSADGLRQSESPVLHDVTGLAWFDDDTLLYAVGKRGGSAIYQVRASPAGLGPPTELLAHREEAGWIGVLAAGGGRVFLTLVSSLFSSQLGDLRDGSVARLDPVAAAAPLGWLDAGRLIAWNRDTGGVELRAREPSALLEVTRARLTGDPVNATRAGDLLVVTQRDDAGRRVEAVELPTGRVAWTAAPGQLRFVRCAGDAAEPCVAGVATDDRRTELRRIDPRTGALGERVLEAGDYADAALDARGRELAWITGNVAILRRPLAGGAPRRVGGHLTAMHTLAFLADGALVAGAGDQVVRLDGARTTRLFETSATVLSLVRPAPGDRHVHVRARVMSSELAELHLPAPTAPPAAAPR